MSSEAKAPAAAATGLKPSPGAEGSLSLNFLADGFGKVRQDPRYVVARNAISNVDNDLLEIIQNRDAVQNYNHVYSNKVSKQGKSTSQKSSGRCWMFAALNAMRITMMKKYDLPSDFELSQAYLFFYDKLERGNWFLEQMIAHRSKPCDDRLVSHLNSDPLGDGGQWDMIVNLVNKYGVVPKSVYPETKSCVLSRRMNWFLKNKLRSFACELRDNAASGASEDQLRTRKAEMMHVFQRILVIFFGQPPEQFDWVYYDKSGDFHAERGLTPARFYADFVPFDADGHVSLINDPRNEYYRLYTVQALGNVIGGHPIRYINVPADDLRRYAKATMDADSPVWFGCDVGKHFHRKLGVMDMELFDYSTTFGTGPGMDKRQRLLYGESLMTHAMCFTAYDAVPSTATDTSTSFDGLTLKKWRVENSWGETGGDKGYLLMTDNWFEQYVYQIAVDKARLPENILAVLSQEPVTLPAWDPMGALAASL